MFFPYDYSFYVLGDLNLPNIDWTISSADYNESHDCFIDFCRDNFLTQVVESPSHKNGNKLDLLISNNFGLDKVISHSIAFPLTNTCDHNLNSFKISKSYQCQKRFV